MKHAYLTIDDAPSADFSAKVDLLRRHGIPALFFVIGERLEARFDQVVAAVKAGFVVGNHSYTHPHFSDLALDDALGEIEGTDGLIDEVYRAAGMPRPGKFFRFPYFDRGAHGSGAEYEAQWSLPEAQRKTPRLDTSDVVLVHDHENTAALFRRLVDRYLERGIVFRAIEEGETR